MGYQLYFDKEKCLLEIKPLSKIFKDQVVTEEVRQYNHCYYFCSIRKNLKEKAKELKDEWFMEAVDRMNKVSDIKI